MTLINVDRDADAGGPAEPALRVRSSVAVAELVASMSRALVEISKLPSLSRSELGLSEFVVLIELERGENATNGRLAKKIGVSAQRMNQVVSELVKNGLAGATTDVQDSRKRFIHLTDLGRDRVRSVMTDLDTVSIFDEETIHPLSRRLARIARVLAERTEAV